MLPAIYFVNQIRGCNVLTCAQLAKLLLISGVCRIGQVQLIDLLLQKSGLPQGSDVLDVGCGIGGTSRYLAKEHGCTVTGITISGQQVQMAQRLSRQSIQTPTSSQSASSSGTPVLAQDATTEDAFDQVGKGKVKFLELDAEKMGDFFTPVTFDAVWISEAMSHLPNKQLFFENALKLLKPGGRLVIADWFKAEDLTSAQMSSDIQPIEDGMLLPPLCTQQGYVDSATSAGLHMLAEPMDISKQVAKTW
jgi:tocopherol O-methyltransferase